MTLKKGNKEILRLSDDVRKSLKAAYAKEDLKAVNAILIDFMEDCDKLEKIPAKYSDFRNYNYLTVSFGNSKLSKGFITLNVGTGLFCPMDILGNCGNCLICYAKAGNRRHFKNTVPKNCVNQIVINRVLLGEITLHEVLYNTIYNIMDDMSETAINNMSEVFADLRIDVESDILNNDILYLIDDIAKVFIDVFNLETAYSYTHNKGLDLKAVRNINFNTSDWTKKGFNQFKAVDRLTFELRQEVIKGNIYLCLGNCSNCKYCKINHGKTIIVLKHGYGYPGVSDEEKIFYSYIASDMTDCRPIGTIGSV